MSSILECFVTLGAGLYSSIAKEQSRTEAENLYRDLKEVYDEMRRGDYESYIPYEMSRLNSELSEIRRYLSSDPREAKRLGRKTAEHMRSMSSLVKKAKSQFERRDTSKYYMFNRSMDYIESTKSSSSYRSVSRKNVSHRSSELEKERREREKREKERLEKERIKREQYLKTKEERREMMNGRKIQEDLTATRGELEALYFQLLQEITNPITVNFAANALQEVRQEIERNEITSRDVLRDKVKKITSEAEVKAEEWKKQTIEENRKQDIEVKLDEAEKRILQERIENKKKTDEFVEKIKKLRYSLVAEQLDISALNSQIDQIETEVDDVLISEEVRRETVKAIIRQLRSQEFTVEKPRIEQEGTDNYVKIVAQRPSGKRVECRLDLHGKLRYEFDNYEGMTCLQDIEKFNVDLEQIYSVKLSDERVLWNNPDKLSKDAETIPENNGRNA